jgi:murein DD-endopeptidase MepM/ murein hydrolase activator NlpD
VVTRRTKQYHRALRKFRAIGRATALVCLFGASQAAAIELRFPVDCVVVTTCWLQNYMDHDSSDAARDYACGAQTYDAHSGTDIRLPSMAQQREGVSVLAAAGGRVAGVRDGMADVSVNDIDKGTIKGRECGNGVVVRHSDGFETQYCHMASGSVEVKPGDEVKAGQALGKVGLSGNTEYAHLHFTVRQNGKNVDPFAFGAADGACNGGTSLWEPALRASLKYRHGAILNKGFASRPIKMDDIESGEAERLAPAADSPVLIAFVRAIGLQKGDVQRMLIEGPDGARVVDSTMEALDRPKAQYMMFAGRKRPPDGWKPGTYRATYSINRGGSVVLEERFDMTL